MYALLELIIKNSRQNKLLNINDIEIIVEKLLEIYDVDEYLKNVRYTNSKTLYVGAYDSIKKELVFNYKKILNVILNIKKESCFKVYDNYILYFNIVILQIIMHEFEHIYQEKVICNIDNEYSKFIKNFYMFKIQLVRNIMKYVLKKGQQKSFLMKKLIILLIICRILI